MHVSLFSLFGRLIEIAGKVAVIGVVCHLRNIYLLGRGLGCAGLHALYFDDRALRINMRQFVGRCFLRGRVAIGICRLFVVGLAVVERVVQILLLRLLLPRLLFLIFLRILSGRLVDGVVEVVGECVVDQGLVLLTVLRHLLHSHDSSGIRGYVRVLVIQTVVVSRPFRIKLLFILLLQLDHTLFILVLLSLQFVDRLLQLLVDALQL